MKCKFRETLLSKKPEVSRTKRVETFILHCICACMPLTKSFLFAFRTMLCHAILRLFRSENFHCFSQGKLRSLCLLLSNIFLKFSVRFPLSLLRLQLRVQSRVLFTFMKSLPAISAERKFFKLSHSSQFIGGEIWRPQATLRIFVECHAHIIDTLHITSYIYMRQVSSQ